MRLNETAHEVLSRCDGRTTVGEIVAALCAEYEVDADALRADVIECLAQLHRRQLVVFAA
jgi:pyrroloquinoline quinone biosynthesis protein D